MYVVTQKRYNYTYVWGAILTVAELVIEAVVEEVKLWLIGLLVDCSNEYPGEHKQDDVA